MLDAFSDVPVKVAAQGINSEVDVLSNLDIPVT
jgi:hypothetical protein